jgi:hypothetical protein
MEFYVLRLAGWLVAAGSSSEYHLLLFLQTFITNYFRNVNKPGRRLGRLINYINLARFAKFCYDYD